MEEAVFTSMRLTIMLVFVILNSLESFVKVSYLSAINAHNLNAMQSCQHFYEWSKNAGIFVNLYFAERMCGLAVIPPILISKNRIVGGVEVVANSWPWQVSLQRNSKSINQNTNATILMSFYRQVISHYMQIVMSHRKT